MYKERIGFNAGLVWKVLENGELNLKAVKKATKLAEKDLNLALGWLAREGKISFREENEGEVFVALV
ncbi:MAG: winged helix-turn-helix domain-containing protein [Paludibacteraceae bacterium]